MIASSSEEILEIFAEIPDTILVEIPEGMTDSFFLKESLKELPKKVFVMGFLSKFLKKTLEKLLNF